MCDFVAKLPLAFSVRVCMHVCICDTLMYVRDYACCKMFVWVYWYSTGLCLCECGSLPCTSLCASMCTDMCISVLVLYSMHVLYSIDMCLYVLCVYFEGYVMWVHVFIMWCTSIIYNMMWLYSCVSIYIIIQVMYSYEASYSVALHNVLYVYLSLCQHVYSNK